MPSPEMKIFPTIQDILKVTSHNDEDSNGMERLLGELRFNVGNEDGGTVHRQHRQEVKEFAVAEQFSFVFDSMNKLKLTSGFIQGTMMSLPVGFT